MKENQIEELIAVIEIEKELCGKPCDICKMNQEQCMPYRMAKKLAAKGWRNASSVAEEIFDEIDDFQRKLRHIFLNMCGGNDYNTLNLLQIDNAIEALYDIFIAELKNKYESEKGNG